MRLASKIELPVANIGGSSNIGNGYVGVEILIQSKFKKRNMHKAADY